MKIVRYRSKKTFSYGVLRQETIVCLPVLAKIRNKDFPSSLEQLIFEKNGLDLVKLLFSKSKQSELDQASISLSEVALLAPIDFPPKILCLGWNYIDHTSETKRVPPEEPVVFIKPHTAIIGPYDRIDKRPFVNELDYEGELTVVMGSKAKDVPESDALNYVFGYTIMNDVSARDFQFRDKQWTRGKGFDTFAPIGPCITTIDELPNVQNLRIRTWVNGELRQNGSTKNMLFNISQVIYHLSRVMTLEPCDLISTGTPAGVAMAMHPQQWLKDGDVVRIEIEGIGTIENAIVEK